MSDLKSTATAVWHGDLKAGRGVMSAGSGVIKEAPYTFATRFEGAAGTNPEEMLAAALAACFSMAFAATLSKGGNTPDSIQTKATCHLSPVSGGFKITKMVLHVEGKVPGLVAADFKKMAQEQACPVSNMMKNGLDIEVAEAVLL